MTMCSIFNAKNSFIRISKRTRRQEVVKFINTYGQVIQKNLDSFQAPYEINGLCNQKSMETVFHYVVKLR